MTQQAKIEPNLESLEKALAPIKSEHNFAPPDQRGIRELVAETRDMASSALRMLELIEQRLGEFDRLQSNFYNGRR